MNTPRVVTNQAQQVVWRWEHQEPFGKSLPEENPSGFGTFEFNLRFPGQYFDKETNTAYNYRRTYDPAIGRYLEPDPIGLRGGINTYLYVGGNPLRYVDPLGLITLPEAQYLGGLLSKGAKPLSEQLIKILSVPGSAGAIVAAQLCAAYGGRTPRDLFNDCTTGCLNILQMIQGLTIVSGGWLGGCVAACEQQFRVCNKPSSQSAVCLPNA